mmetsp:Transcript_20919/g.58023  ORF Transcript_20919/g.58023 Transcript_20919/m.58023 type:complete len:250 (+) Transcript_20919:720-1469(+)
MLAGHQEALELHNILVREVLLHSLQAGVLLGISNNSFWQLLAAVLRHQRGGAPKCRPIGSRQVRGAADELQACRQAAEGGGGRLAALGRGPGERPQPQGSHHEEHAQPVACAGGDEAQQHTVEDQHEPGISRHLVLDLGLEAGAGAGGRGKRQPLQLVVQLVAWVRNHGHGAGIAPDGLPLCLEAAHKAVVHPDSDLPAGLQTAGHGVAPGRGDPHQDVPPGGVGGTPGGLVHGGDAQHRDAGVGAHRV